MEDFEGAADVGKLAGEVLWASMGPLDQPTGSPGWVVKLDRKTGEMMGHIDVAEPRTGHGLDLSPSGEPVITAGDHLIWFTQSHDER